MLLSRSNHRGTAWLALFALWLQLALSFGHLHPEDFAGLGPSGQEWLSGAPLGTPLAPLDPLSEGPGHDACVICATMHLAGSAPLPEPIQIAAPAFSGAAIVFVGTVLRLALAPHLLFQTRAPPLL